MRSQVKAILATVAVTATLVTPVFQAGRAHAAHAMPMFCTSLGSDLSSNFSPGYGNVEIQWQCLYSQLGGQLNGLPSGATNVGINLYSGYVGSGTLLVQGSYSAITQRTCHGGDPYYSFGAYTYNGQRYGQNSPQLNATC